jgi:orotate phosphoribosyltransferase
MKLDRTSRWIDTYRNCGALWIHDGKPRRPHALLTSGRHSSGFFNSGIVAEDPSLVAAASVDLAGAVCEEVDASAFTYVVGPAMGAVVVAHCMASAFRVLTGSSCRASFTEKVAGPGGSAGVVLKRSSLREGVDEVLVVEDVLTTGGSAEATIEAVARAGGRVAPVVAVLVNRSGLSRVQGDRKIVSLVDRPMPTWSAEECPLCRQGSEAIRPKGAENWARLNADY